MYLKEFADKYNINYGKVRKCVHMGKDKDFFKDHTQKISNKLFLDDEAIKKLKILYINEINSEYYELHKIRLLLEQLLKNKNKGFWERLFDKFGLTF